MNKFPANFILVFVLTISFFLPASNAIAGPGYPAAYIAQNSYTKKEQSGYTCASTKTAVAPSLVNRLLAAISLAKPTQLSESTSGCDSAGRAIGKVTESAWSANLFAPHVAEFLGDRYGDERYSKSVKITYNAVYTSQYGTTPYTNMHTYTFLSGTGKGTIVVTGPFKSASGDVGYRNTYEANYPPNIPTDNANGTFSGRFQSGNIIENFSVTETSRNQLSFSPPDIPGAEKSAYVVPIGAAAWELVLNKQTNTFVDVPVKCTDITVAGKPLDINCRTSVSVKGAWVTMDVTPKVSKPYYTYQVYTLGSPYEK